MARILQINTSPGGVPKLPRQKGLVTPEGIEGDLHLYHKHGGPDKALCLFSLERILALQEEGHPIFPGAIGENLTISGLDWDRLVPGVRLRLGPEVLAKITSYAIPCSKLVPYFKDGDIQRVSQEENPGWARPYASVLETGRIMVGDVVEVVE